MSCRTAFIEGKVISVNLSGWSSGRYCGPVPYRLYVLKRNLSIIISEQPCFFGSSQPAMTNLAKHYMIFDTAGSDFLDHERLNFQVGYPVASEYTFTQLSM